MNWGTKIIIVFSVFVTGIVFMVFKASKQNMDLVVPDYYEQELQYQQVIDAQKRAAALNSLVQCKVQNDSIQIILPQEMLDKRITGNVWLYCIANKKRDIQQNFTTLNGKISFPVTAVNKGAHDVKINWEAEGEQYFFEQKLFIQ
ncbi:MAG: hypothetical protein EOP53_11440 [Sphingobacteriales bacterium]|nr:MAG: hypothetical protein EOP53_11440 [Sphingobacteriales bacterium]